MQGNQNFEVRIVIHENPRATDQVSQKGDDAPRQAELSVAVYDQMKHTDRSSTGESKAASLPGLKIDDAKATEPIQVADNAPWTRQKMNSGLVDRLKIPVRHLEPMNEGLLNLLKKKG